MGKFLSIGEILLRFTPKNFDVYENSNELEYFFGGSEANISSILSAWDIESTILSALPDNDIAKNIKRYFRGVGVDVSNIITKGDKIGCYFLERSLGVRSSSVIYDRKHSSFSELNINDIDIFKVLEGVTWLHFSGITLGVGGNSRELVREILKEAKKRDIFISMDLNFRSKMCNFMEAKKYMTELAPYVDFCFGIEPIMVNEKDTEMFDRENSTKEDIFKRMKKLKSKFAFKYIVHTERINDKEDNNTYYAYGLGEDIQESVRLTTKMIERVGSGDAFASGVIYSFFKEKTLKEALDFGVASATLKCTIKGDSMIVAPKDIEKIILEKNIIDR
ncbi:sugar kinase [Clostridium tagluense]|uniref:sugar kinase n=1 Tax=Clostridium tagluense TaxID=360422 RepID=UPI001C6DF6EB|nr:sugar kinase [Clostridium tagluense]MBW9158183.1 sugar kinase [Clostridium tagluense]WLC67505.1 sugar kinase [Clostridium tagluense]